MAFVGKEFTVVYNDGTVWHVVADDTAHALRRLSDHYGRHPNPPTVVAVFAGGRVPLVGNRPIRL